MDIQLAQELAAQLHWPHNQGVEFRPVRVGTLPGYLLWIDGLASTAVLESSLLPALPGVPGPADPETTAAAINLLKFTYRRETRAILDDILNGMAALVAEGWDGALLINTAQLPNHHALQLSPNPLDDQFAREIRFNLALLRKRLRSPDLVARTVRLKDGRTDSVMIVAMEDRARPSVIRAVRRWAWCHASEEGARRGLLTGTGAVWGMIPRFSPERWPDKVAALLETGHVALLIDRNQLAFVAPVTAAGDVLSASDSVIAYPLRRWLIRVRLVLYLLVLFLPGTVVALLNYHSEMIPTSFLTAIASARENAPFGIFFEVLFLELLVDLAREAALRLEAAISVGIAFTGTLLLVLMAVLGGFFGPTAAVSATLGAMTSLALPGHVGTYIVRTWRYYLLFAAVMFGFFGMAAGAEILLLMLCAGRTWGVPFLGPSGWHVTAPEASAAKRPPRRGKQRNGSSGTAIR